MPPMTWANRFKSGFLRPSDTKNQSAWWGPDVNPMPKRIHKERTRSKIGRPKPDFPLEDSRTKRQKTRSAQLREAIAREAEELEANIRQAYR